MFLQFKKYIQAVPEIRVLILTSGRSRQFMKFFSTTFLRKTVANVFNCDRNRTLTKKLH
jgi:hypothetical protein